MSFKKTISYIKDFYEKNLSFIKNMPIAQKVYIVIEVLVK